MAICISAVISGYVELLVNLIRAIMLKQCTVKESIQNASICAKLLNSIQAQTKT